MEFSTNETNAHIVMGHDTGNPAEMQEMEVRQFEYLDLMKGV